MATGNPTFDAMKRIGLLLTLVGLCFTPSMRAQDAAIEERLNKLNGRIEDLTAANEALRKQVDALLKELETVREQANKPTGNYASQEDLNRLRDNVKEVDKKRMEDGEKVRTELLNLRKTLLAPPTGPKPPVVAKPAENASPEKPQKGFEHVVERGETLSAIVQGCKDKNIKVTVDQILKANPGLKPEKLIVGQKIFIPAPQS
jgi:LysM repeat protein